MKLIAELSLKIKIGLLPQFIASLYKYSICINYINLTEADDKWEDYAIEITYSVKKELIRLLDSLNKNSEYFRNIHITSTLEDRIKGGLLKTTGKIEIENINDIETTLLGGSRLIHEKIEAGLGKNYCGCFNSVALISGYKNTRNNPIAHLHHYYAESEKDAVIINRFTGRNAFPCVIRYSSIEDLIKSIKTIEDNYSCLRILKTDEEELPLSSIIDSINRPVISYEFDEEPLFYLALINKIVDDQKIKPNETAIGIVGLSPASIRLTALLNRSGFAKVLGYDARERIMMSFETRKGLATTVENIVANCDIILLMDEQSEFAVEENMRAGQIYISRITTSKSPQELIKNKGLKDFIQTDENSPMPLMPGMLNGLLLNEEKYFSDDMLVKLAELVAKLMTEKNSLPGMFGELQEKIELQMQRG